MYKKKHLKLIKPDNKPTNIPKKKALELPFRQNDHRFNENLIVENLRKEGFNV